MRQQCVSYHINKEHRIVFLNDNWQSFADQNSASNLTRHAVLNESIFTFISDESCRHLYQMLIERCRKEQQALSLSFRCDSPAKRRFMFMKVTPLTKGSIGFESCVVREEARNPVQLLDSKQKRSDEFVKICSWCKKIKVDDYFWVEVEEAIEHLGLFSASLFPELTHGICPACFEYVREKFSE